MTKHTGFSLYVFLFVLLVVLLAGCGPRTFTVTVEIQGNGSVTPEAGEPHTYTAGDSVSFRAVAHEGNVFVGWKADSGSFADNKDFETTFTVPEEDAVVTAIFSQIEYNVEFLDWDDTHLGESVVTHGNTATPPEDPVREGHTFVGWEPEFTNVTRNLTVKAKYQINEYAVVFMDWDEQILDEQVVEHGSAATSPEHPNRDGYTFVGWEVSYDKVTEDLIVRARYEITKYKVTFQEQNSLGGVSIKVYSSGKRSENNQEDPLMIIGEDGEATIMLTDGVYSYTAKKEGYNEFRGDAIVDGSESIVEFSLRPKPGSISGIITDDETGDVIDGAQIEISEVMGKAAVDQVVTTVSENGGSYLVDELKPSAYQVRIEADWYQPIESYTVEVGPGEHLANEDFPLTRINQEVASIRLADSGDNWISFVVTDTEGQPYDGTAPWAVSLRQKDGAALQDAPFTVTYEEIWSENIGAEGRATVVFEDFSAGLGLNREVELVFETDDGAQAIEIVLTVVRWANKLHDVREK